MSDMTDNKVHLLMESMSYEGSWVIGAFTTEDLANNALAKVENARANEPYNGIDYYVEAFPLNEFRG